MSHDARTAFEHSVFTPGNYYYNGVGHVTVDYPKVLAVGYAGIIAEAQARLDDIKQGDPDYGEKYHFLTAVITSCKAACDYAKRYSALAAEMAGRESDPERSRELREIARICSRVPESGACSFYEACQSFWFVQQLLQIESSGHSISPGR